MKGAEFIKKVYTMIKKIILFSPLIMIILPFGIACYDEYIILTKEVVIDECVVRGITYDGSATLLVVELPDHTLSIVDASVTHSRGISDRPNVSKGQVIRCRWKYGDTGKMGYSSWKKGDMPSPFRK